MEIVLDQDKQNAVFPFSKQYPFYVIIETGSSEVTLGSQDGEKKNDADLDKMFSLFDIAGE